MLIIVGSTNPSKLSGVELAAKRAFPHEKITVRGISVKSGISEQPFGAITIKGAMNRARSVYRKAKGKGELFVGLESGIFNFGKRYFDIQWCAICAGPDEFHLGMSMGFEVPRKEVEKLRRHRITLSQLYDELTGDRDIGKKHGVIGHLSRGLLKRSDMTEQAFLCALLPIISKRTAERIDAARKRIKTGDFMTEKEARKRLGL